jgi:hypothetical protein
MKKIATIFLSLLMMISAAHALDQASVPPKFPIPWANSAGNAYIRSIPQNSQIGVQNCAASLTDGFPPLTFQQASAGGCPPFGADMNGILKQLSQWSLWQAAGSPTLYDSSFQSSIAGYPAGAIISAAANGCFWLSTANGNTSNPESGGGNWASYCVGNSSATTPTSTGSANSQIITTKPFTLQVGSTVSFVAGFTNSGAMQVNVNGAGLTNLYRLTQAGPAATVGGEVVFNSIITMKWDGTQWQISSGANPSITVICYINTGGSFCSDGATHVSGGSYNSIPGTTQLEVFQVGGGAGGAGTGLPVGGSGQNGIATTFNGVTAAAGSVGTPNNSNLAGVGGPGGVSGAGSALQRIQGQTGQSGTTQPSSGVASLPNPIGGLTSLGTLGSGGAAGASANSGMATSGAGGGAEYSYSIINSPSGNYSYGVGAGGAGGVAGSSGQAGTGGNSGGIIVKAHFN